MAKSVTEQLVELIHRNTSDLPEDVEAALSAAADGASSDSELLLLHALLENAVLARQQGTPLCQDTGWLSFFWTIPPGTDASPLRAATEEAVAIATANGWLRRNTIDALTGASTDTNAVPGVVPVCHFETDSAADGITVSLLQKGGGSENMSRQFSLPDASLGSHFFGLRAGAIGEMSAFLLIAGGLYLAWRRILRPSLPILCFLTLGVLVYLEPTLAAVSDVVAIRSALYHILGSNTLLVAVYLLGDPVTTPKSSRGTMVAGILAGLIIFYVRRDIDPAISALAAVPMINLLTPLLDRFLAPSVFGGRRKKPSAPVEIAPTEEA